MFRKIRFYKLLIIEIVETLCSVCLYLSIDGAYKHNKYAIHMRDHYETLKAVSEELRG